MNSCVDCDFLVVTHHVVVLNTYFHNLQVSHLRWNRGFNIVPESVRYSQGIVKPLIRMLQIQVESKSLIVTKCYHR